MATKEPAPQKEAYPCGDSLSERANNLQPVRPKKKEVMFSFGGSSDEDEKQTSFQEEVANRTIDEDTELDYDVFETGDEDDLDESAIDDDDSSSDWEACVEGSGNPSIVEKTFFQRVDSRPNLTMR
jgi:hypothetical protein